MLTSNQEAILDLLALAHSIEPMRLSPPHIPHIWDVFAEQPECPITHAARVLVGETYGCRSVKAAAEALDIPANEVMRVVAAADWETPNDELRAALIAVYTGGQS